MAINFYYVVENAVHRKTGIFARLENTLYSREGNSFILRAKNLKVLMPDFLRRFATYWRLP